MPFNLSIEIERQKMSVRNRLIAAVAVFSAIICPTHYAFADQSPLLEAFLDAVNSHDRAKIETFVEHHFATDLTVADAWPTRCCAKDDVVLALLNIAKRSGGLVSDEVHSQNSNVVAFAHTRIGKTSVYISLSTAATRPDRIVNYQLMPVLAPEQYLPALPPDTPLTNKLDLVRAAVEKGAQDGLFSGAFVVARAGKVLLSGAYGEADRERHVPNRLETPIDIASTGKLFTGVAVAQLVAKGKLDYSAPIIRYLPEYPNETAASKITLRQLLTHSSGLADIFSHRAPNVKLERLTDYYALFANEPLLFDPGKGQSYSNTGFLVASMIVERVSGEDFRSYVKEHIFEPAGMTHTGFGHSPAIAIPYARANGDDPLNPASSLASALPFYKGLLGGPAAGQGGEYSTAPDLLRFASALRTGAILDPVSFETILRNNYGCFCSAKQGHRVYAHSGGGPGINAFFLYYPDQDLVVIFLSNFSPPFAQVIGQAAATLLAGQ